MPWPPAQENPAGILTKPVIGRHKALHVGANGHMTELAERDRLGQLGRLRTVKLIELGKRVRRHGRQRIYNLGSLFPADCDPWQVGFLFGYICRGL